LLYDIVEVRAILVFFDSRVNILVIFNAWHILLLRTFSYFVCDCM